MSEFTRETLIRYADPTNKAFGPTVRHLAAYTLTLLDRAERAERELREAEEAILWFHGYDIGPGYPDFPPSEPKKRYGFRSVSHSIPAVRRALDRKGEG